MGLIRNIKESIDDKSSMSTGSITLLLSAIIGAIIGLCVCFVLIYDVTYDGKVDTDLLDLGIFLMSSGGYILGSGMPKTIVDSRMKRRSWIDGEKAKAEAEEDIEDMRAERKRKREQNVDENNENEDI
jgi:hypothetical protein